MAFLGGPELVAKYIVLVIALLDAQACATRPDVDIIEHEPQLHIKDAVKQVQASGVGTEGGFKPAHVARTPSSPQAAVGTSLVAVNGSTKLAESAKAKNTDGICYCTSSTNDRVVWDDFETFHSQAKCLHECPRICLEHGKALVNAPFLTCAAKDKEGYECSCIDFDATAKDMRLPNGNAVYGHIFVKWYGREKKTSKLFDDVVECGEKCTDTCQNARKLEDFQGVRINPSSMLGVCSSAVYTNEDAATGASLCTGLWLILIAASLHKAQEEA